MLLVLALLCGVKNAPLGLALVGVVGMGSCGAKWELIGLTLVVVVVGMMLPSALNGDATSAKLRVSNPGEKCEDCGRDESVGK